MYSAPSKLVSHLLAALGEGRAFVLEYQAAPWCKTGSCRRFVEALPGAVDATEARALRESNDRALAVIQLECEGSTACGRWSVLLLRFGGFEYGEFWRVASITRSTALGDAWLRGGPWVRADARGARPDATTNGNELSSIVQGCYLRALMNERSPPEVVDSVLTIGPGGAELAGGASLSQSAADCLKRARSPVRVEFDVSVRMSGP